MTARAPVVRKYLIPPVTLRSRFETVFVMESAQNRRRDDAIAIGHAVTVRRHPSIRRRIRKSRPQTAVRAPAVVMGDPLPKHDAKVPLGQRDHEVQAFPTNCADYPLAERIRLWNARGRLEHFQTHRPEGSIDAVRVNRVPIVDHEPVPLIADTIIRNC